MIRLTPGQTVFARWKNSYYYPAIVNEILDDQINVSFLDGCTGSAAREHVMELEEALQNLTLQGNWKHGGFFFKGVLASRNPLIMNYNDGDVEQIELSQLRGKRLSPGETPAPNPRKISAQDVKAEVEQLKSLRKTGMITKDEFKRMKKSLK
ncbi:MAG: hypothetical protein FWE08_02140 [Oscillospiraceae bacterium]|nr:hypothetical protein [Oscillospiraceae bacterium]